MRPAKAQPEEQIFFVYFPKTKSQMIFHCEYKFFLLRYTEHREEFYRTFQYFFQKIFSHQFFQPSHFLLIAIGNYTKVYRDEFDFAPAL